MLKRSTKSKATVTPREYAQKHGVAYTTVMKWLQRGLIAGAVKEALPAPFEGYIYRVPEDAPRPTAKPGPKPSAKKAGPKK